MIARQNSHLSPPIRCARQKVRPKPVFNLATTLIYWAQANQLQAVVAYRTFIGLWLTEALAIEARLAATAIKVIWRRRGWDAQHFPHATRGYFPFWEKIRTGG